MTRNDPKITVLMPVYNGAEYLRPAIESVLGQSFTDFEFLIINDGSTDGTAGTVRSFPDPRIRFFENERNLGLIATLNRGIGLARGQYLARQDADDISLPERLRVQNDFLDARPGIALTGSWTEVIDADGRTTGLIRRPAAPDAVRWRLLFTDCMTHSSVMGRTPVFRQAGGYDGAMLHTEDYDLWSRISRAHGIAQIARPLVKLRRHGRSLSAMNREQQFANSVGISQRNIEELLRHPVPRQTADDLYHIGMGLFKESLDPEKDAALVREVFHAFVGARSSGRRNGVISREYARTLRDVASMSANYSPGKGLPILLGAAAAWPPVLFEPATSAALAKLLLGPRLLPLARRVLGRRGP